MLDNISGINLSFIFGDGNSFTDVLNVSSPIMVIIRNNYSNGGQYSVNISTAYDGNVFDDKFGVDAKSLSLISNNRSVAFIQFDIENDIQETGLNVAWNCSNGIASNVSFNISSDTMVLITLIIS